MPRSPRDTALRWGEGSIERTPSGKWQARWTDHDVQGFPKRRAKSFTARDDAEDYLRNIFRQRSRNEYIAPDSRTVQDLVLEWLSRGVTRWKAATTAAYTQRAKTHVLPQLGHVLANQLTTPKVQYWIDSMVRRGFEPSTVDGACRVLIGTFNQAVHLGLLSRNPTTGTVLPSIQMKPATTWTPEETAKIIAAIGDDPMWLAVYRIMLVTGMRPGELRGLRWGDVNWETNIITIRRTITRDENNHDVVGTTTKTGHNRSNPIPANVMALLSRWRTLQKARQLATAEWPKDAHIFDRGDGSFLARTTWQKKHDRILKAAGVADVTFHGMRHTNATISLESGTHPKIVQERLGHRSIATTLDRYSHVSVDLQRATADELDKRMFGDSAVAEKDAVS